MPPSHKEDLVPGIGGRTLVNITEYYLDTRLEVERESKLKGRYAMYVSVEKDLNSC